MNKDANTTGSQQTTGCQSGGKKGSHLVKIQSRFKRLLVCGELRNMGGCAQEWGVGINVACKRLGLLYLLLLGASMWFANNSETVHEIRYLRIG